MGWLIAIGIIILLAILPLGLSVIYNEDGLVIWNVIGPIRYIDDPDKKEDKEEEEDSEKKKDPEDPSKKKKRRLSLKKIKKKLISPIGGTVGELLPFLRSDWKFIGDLLRRIYVKRLEINVVIAGSDPADLALDYGKTWALIGNIYALLEQFFLIKKRKLDVQCSSFLKKTLIFLRLDVRISLARVIYLIVRSAVRAVENNKNNDKGGSVK